MAASRLSSSGSGVRVLIRLLLGIAGCRSERRADGLGQKKSRPCLGRRRAGGGSRTGDRHYDAGGGGGPLQGGFLVSTGPSVAMGPCSGNRVWNLMGSSLKSRVARAQGGPIPSTRIGFAFGAAGRLATPPGGRNRPSCTAPPTPAGAAGSPERRAGPWQGIGHAPASRDRRPSSA